MLQTFAFATPSVERKKNTCFASSICLQIDIHKLIVGETVFFEKENRMWKAGSS